MKGTPKLVRIYVDANIIIEAAKQRYDTHDKTRENDLWTFEQMLQAAEDGELELYTSSISIAECTHVDGSADESTQQFFRRFLSAGSLIKLAQDSIFVAEKARDLRWDHDVRLSGMDAIHAATALDAGCKEMISWDGGIAGTKLAEAVPKLKALGLWVIAPSDSTQLPRKYRQGVLKLSIRKSRKPKKK